MTLGYTGNVFPPKQTTTMSGLYLNILEMIFCQGSEAVIPSNPNDSTTVDAKWTKKSKTNPYRDFKDDDDQVTKNKRRTAQQKSTTLDLMLGQIANDCPVIYRNVIAKKSLNPWSRFSIRLHFGFQSSGEHFLNFNDILFHPDERPEDLYQRLLVFINDNLIKREGGITHHGVNVEEDEEMSPTVENLIVLTFLRLINPSLPQIVK